MIVLRKRGADCQFVSVLEPWKKKPGDLQISTDQSSANHLRITVKQSARTDAITFDPTNIQFAYDIGSRPDDLTDVKLREPATLQVH